jgi:hypothetical protein
MAMDEMRIYRLVPVAAPDDPNWGRAFNHGELMVRAPSSGEARAIAAFAEARARGAEDPPKVTTEVRASAFLDEKLYGLVEVMDGPMERDGPPGVIAGSFDFPPDLLPDHDD